MSGTIMSADQHLQEALTQLKREESERVAAFDKEMQELRRKIDAVESALSPKERGIARNLLQPSIERFVGPSQEPARPNANLTSKASSEKYDPPNELVAQVRGKTQPEALYTIAQYNGGVIRTVEAKQVFLKAGLSHGNPKNIINHIFATLRSPERFQKWGVEFERIGAGEYRMVESAAQDGGQASLAIQFDRDTPTTSSP